MGGMANVLFHQGNCLGVFEARNEKITLHVHDLLLAERTRLMLAFNGAQSSNRTRTWL